MPTNRKRARRPSQAQPWQTEYMLTGYYMTRSGEKARTKVYTVWGDGFDAKISWPQCRDELLPGFIREFPCQRPFSWWDYDAPEPRRRVGGTGGISESRYSTEFGTPAPNTWWAGINPDDPPTFQSQSSFLQRHNLLTAPEQKFLKQHPELLKPVKIGYLTYDETGKMVVVEAPEAR